MTEKELRIFQQQEEKKRKEADEATMEYFLEEIVGEEESNSKKDPEKYNPEEYQLYYSDNGNFIENIENKIDAELGYSENSNFPLIPGEIFDIRTMRTLRSNKTRKIHVSKKGKVTLLRKISLAV